MLAKLFNIIRASHQIPFKWHKGRRINMAPVCEHYRTRNRTNVKQGLTEVRQKRRNWKTTVSSVCDAVYIGSYFQTVLRNALILSSETNVKMATTDSSTTYLPTKLHDDTSDETVIWVQMAVHSLEFSINYRRVIIFDSVQSLQSLINPDFWGMNSLIPWLG
jgi:hypothetical protein